MAGFVAAYPDPHWSVIGVGALVLARVFRSSEVRVATERRHAFAGVVMHELQGGGTDEVFSLYLRGFDFDGRLRSYHKEVDPTTLLMPWSSELEEMLANALANAAPLIALGHNAYAPCAGRIAVSDDEWKQWASALIAHARCVILVPSHHSGTIWEISFLKDAGFLPKTIFVMPPLSATPFPVKAGWDAARTACAEIGVALPQYQGTGMLFRLNDKSEIEAWRQFRPRRRALEEDIVKRIGRRLFLRRL